MLARLIRAKWPLPAAAAVVIALVIGSAVVSAQDSGNKLVIYNGRSHYGDEQVFKDFEKATGIKVQLRGGTGPELYERLRREGDKTPADVLVTTDLANLWRAKESGLLQPVKTPALEANIPAALHDDDGSWWAISTRMRIPVVATERVQPSAVTSYADLGDPKYKGRTCLRTSNNEYNESLVADMIVKRGRDATRDLLKSWMANNPKILNSDGEMLAVMAAGGCDVGLANHYYLGRALLENPKFPVAPAWPDQNGAGAHTNISGAGIVKWSDNVEAATKLIEYLTSPSAEALITAGSEFAANPAVPPPAHIKDWGNVKQDPIAVNKAGPVLEDAIALMLEVGWN
jgi:iron(III) transport system substrate-binding protein